MEESLHQCLSQVAENSEKTKGLEVRVEKLEKSESSWKSFFSRRDSSEKRIGDELESLKNALRAQKDDAKRNEDRIKDLENELKTQKDDAKKKEQRIGALENELKAQKDRFSSERKETKEELSSLKRDLEASSKALRGALNYLRALEHEKVKRNQEDGLSAIKRIDLDILVDSKPSGDSLRDALQTSLGKYFEVHIKPLKERFSDSPATIAIVVLFSPTDRWFDSLGNDTKTAVLDKYGDNLLILLKPLADPSKLKYITDLKGFSSIDQILLTSEMKLVPHAHNSETLNQISKRIHTAKDFEIRSMEERAKRQSQPNISLSQFLSG